MIFSDGIEQDELTCREIHLLSHRNEQTVSLSDHYAVDFEVRIG